ncbi:MAG TPA: CcmD family protein [Dehalococcoidales bacterium]|nr:CcmD family protein [Dehalococcoidales bacterium]
MSSLAYLGIAFAIVWVVLFGYIWILNSRQMRTERELKRLLEEKKK